MDLHALGFVPFRWCSSKTRRGPGREAGSGVRADLRERRKLWIGRDSALTHVLTNGRVVNFDIPRVIQEIEDSEGARRALSSPSSAEAKVCRIQNSAVRCLGPQDGLPIRSGPDSAERAEACGLQATSPSGIGRRIHSKPTQPKGFNRTPGKRVFTTSRSVKTVPYGS